MANDPYNTDGPYIMWLDYGYDGWHPHSFNSVKEALEYDRGGYNFVITRPVKYEVTATETDTNA